jgi:hypothetical protein
MNAPPFRVVPLGKRLHKDDLADARLPREVRPGTGGFAAKLVSGPLTERGQQR